MVFPYQACLERDVINLIGILKWMSQQLTVLCETRGVTMPEAANHVIHLPNPTHTSPSCIFRDYLILLSRFSHIFFVTIYEIATNFHIFS